MGREFRDCIYPCRKAAFGAEREIILCGGAVNSPQLLMLSGIGPADHLSSLGIPVVLDASEVGRNLQNHPSYALRYACSQIRSMPGAKR